MSIREIAIFLIVCWTSASCWSAPWNPVLWPIAHSITQYGVFAGLFALTFSARARNHVIDLSIISVLSAMAAMFLWDLWMMHGWFYWDWVTFLAFATKSDGEGAYRMVEYQFFLIVFSALVIAWLVLRSNTSVNTGAPKAARPSP